MAKITEPPLDTRVWRQVVAYDDRVVTLGDVRSDTAFDVLECGHHYECTRQPGGRKVVGHQEPCANCSETPC